MPVSIPRARNWFVKQEVPSDISLDVAVGNRFLVERYTVTSY
jgi:hypothetical protein